MRKDVRVLGGGEIGKKRSERDCDWVHSSKKKKKENTAGRGEACRFQSEN